MVKETPYKAFPGIPAFVLWLLALVLAVGTFAQGIRSEDAGTMIGGVVVGVVLIFIMSGFFAIQPNHAKALTLFGKYKGTVRTEGLWWVNPFVAKKEVSLRVRNFETAKLKVNDNDSNPIEIGAVVVWQVIDSAEALFEVDNYEDYVRVQSESAVRTLATQYPYDAHAPGIVSLSHNAADISMKLAAEVQDRLQKAGQLLLTKK